jgi:hypothetical protein
MGSDMRGSQLTERGTPANLEFALAFESQSHSSPATRVATLHQAEQP